MGPLETFICPSFLWELPPYRSINTCRYDFLDVPAYNAISPADNLPVCRVSELPRVGTGT